MYSKVISMSEWKKKLKKINSQRRVFFFNGILGLTIDAQ